MRSICTLIFMVLFCATLRADDRLTSVAIELVGLASDEGVVYVGLCDEAGWEKFQCRNVQLTPNPDDTRHIWLDVPAGVYGITVLHDANKNGKMDFDFFGAPTEKWGASNNPPPRMGRSRWQDVTFRVDAEPVSLEIRMQ